MQFRVPRGGRVGGWIGRIAGGEIGLREGGRGGTSSIELSQIGTCWQLPRPSQTQSHMHSASTLSAPSKQLEANSAATSTLRAMPPPVPSEFVLPNSQAMGCRPRAYHAAPGGRPRDKQCCRPAQRHARPPTRPGGGWYSPPGDASSRESLHGPRDRPGAELRAWSAAALAFGVFVIVAVR